jgi:hypothetical protein
VILDLTPISGEDQTSLGRVCRFGNLTHCTRFHVSVWSEQNSFPGSHHCIASPKSNQWLWLNWQQPGSAEALLAETGEGNDPWITSTCHCSSCVSKRQARIFLIPRCRVRICSGFYLPGERAATPERCRHSFAQNWLQARTGSAPTLPQKGLCVCAASPAPVFSAPAHGTRPRILPSVRAHSSQQKAFTLYKVPPKRYGEVRQAGMRQKESNRPRSGRRPAATA